VLSQEYLERLIVDLRADVALADQLLISLSVKKSGLAFLAEAASDDSLIRTDPSNILQALPGTLQLAFNAPQFARRHLTT
jgi:hypothetical protein